MLINILTVLGCIALIPFVLLGLWILLVFLAGVLTISIAVIGILIDKIRGV
jgi:hypothetical protein